MNISLQNNKHRHWIKMYIHFARKLFYHRDYREYWDLVLFFSSNSKSMFSSLDFKFLNCSSLQVMWRYSGCNICPTLLAIACLIDGQMASYSPHEYSLRRWHSPSLQCLFYWMYSFPPSLPLFSFSFFLSFSHSLSFLWFCTYWMPAMC